MEFNKYPYNEMSFLPQEHDECMKFINFLMNMKMVNKYNTILILSDGYATIVRWIQKPFDDSYGGNFEYIADVE